MFESRFISTGRHGMDNQGRPQGVQKGGRGQPPGPAPIAVKNLKDKDGNISGYTYQRLIRDFPIYYLDSEGKDLALFHVFGPEEEKRKNGPIIDSLECGRTEGSSTP